MYTRSPLEDSRLFGPSPWKILAATNEKDISEQPSPWRTSSKRESCYEDRVYNAAVWSGATGAGVPRIPRSVDVYIYIYIYIYIYVHIYIYICMHILFIDR